MLWLILVVLPGSAFCQYKVRPFYTHNQSPLVHFFGIPNNEGGSLMSKGEFGFMSHLNMASNATSKKIYNERIYLDGEMYRLDLSLRYGLGKLVTVGVDLPFVRHSSGVMDPLISHWHEALDLPGKARKAQPENAMEYVYQVDGENAIMMDAPDNGIGDLSLSGALKVFQSQIHSLTFSTLLKLPVGDKNKLVGSGTTDIAFHLDGSYGMGGAKRGTRFFYSGGILFIGKGSLLEDIQRRRVGFGSLGWAFGVHHRFVPKLQFDWHTPFYFDTQTKQLGKTSVQMALGADIRLNSNTDFEFGFTEDLIVNTAPDIVFHLGFSHFF